MRRALLAGLSLLTACAAACAPKPAPRPYSVLKAVHDAPAPPPKELPRFEVLPASASKVTFKRLAKIPEPGWVMPKAPQFAPDGKTVTYLASESGDETLSLWTHDLASGKSTVDACTVGGLMKP